MKPFRLTRRAFVALPAAAWCTGRANAADRLRIGVGTYSYHSLPLAAMIAQLQALHIEEIEMSRGEFMLLSHPKAELFRHARSMFDTAGIHCVSYYAATIHDEAELDAAIQFAGLLGAHNITGDATGVQLLQAIDRKCTRANLTFGIHNHFFPTKFAYESPEDVLRALQGLSHTVGATADTGQFVACGHDPVDAIRKLGHFLKVVHLKDVVANGVEENVLLGTGAAKIPEVMRELHRLDFSGLVAVEYEKEGDVNDDMRREIDFARSLA